MSDLTKNQKDKATPDAVAKSKTNARQNVKESEKKWGKAMDHGFLVIPKVLMHSQKFLEVNSSQFLMLLQIAEHWWWHDRMPWPSVKTLSERLVINDRQVRNILNDLEKKGLIKRVPRSASGTIRSQGSNLFDLSGLVKKLKEFEKEYAAKLQLEEKQKRELESPNFVKGRTIRESVIDTGD